MLWCLSEPTLSEMLSDPIIAAVRAPGYGMCGGMAFASLDYWLNNWVVPRGNNRHDQPQRTSPQGTALRDYLWNRLLQISLPHNRSWLRASSKQHLLLSRSPTWNASRSTRELRFWNRSRRFPIYAISSRKPKSAWLPPTAKRYGFAPKWTRPALNRRRSGASAASLQLSLNPYRSE